MVINTNRIINEVIASIVISIVTIVGILILTNLGNILITTNNDGAKTAINNSSMSIYDLTLGVAGITVISLIIWWIITNFISSGKQGNMG